MKALFFAFKWLIVPGVIGVTGFFIIGPYLGTVPEMDERARPLAEILNPSLAQQNEDGEVAEPEGPSAIVEASGQKADHRRRQKPTVRVLNEGNSGGSGSSSDEDDEEGTQL